VDTSKKLEKKDLEGGKKSGICKIMGKKKILPHQPNDKIA
jgi:hypothetical protein